MSVGDLAYHVVKAADEAHVFPRKMTAQERQRETALWVMQELVTLEDRQSLEGRGLIRVNLGRRSWQLPKGLTALGLDETEAWDLLAELIRGVRAPVFLVLNKIDQIPGDPDPAELTPAEKAAAARKAAGPWAARTCTTGATRRTRASIRRPSAG